MPTPDLAEFRARLVAKGHTWTRPRASVLAVLTRAQAPLRVEAIHASLLDSPAGRRINRSSVYRTVHLLLALRILRRVVLADGIQRYELAEGYRAHHHHLLCESCGRIEDVPACPVNGVDLGLAVHSHHLELSGLCGECAAPAQADSVGHSGHVHV